MPDLNRAANVATIVVALCAVMATMAHLDGPSRPIRTDVKPAADSMAVPNWREYLADGHSRGLTTAAVTILEFGDYECPFCARFAADMDKVTRAFPSDLRLVYRHWPLPKHRFAYPAARDAECAAEQDHFWELHDSLYARQDSLGLISFEDLARRAGVPDSLAFRSCFQRQDSVPNISRAISDVRQLGGTGTPTLTINGALIRRPVDSAYIAALISEVRKRER